MFDPRLHRHKKGCTLERSMDLKSNRYRCEIDFKETVSQFNMQHSMDLKSNRNEIDFNETGFTIQHSNIPRT